jgi:hypothetical protein
MAETVRKISTSVHQSLAEMEGLVLIVSTTISAAAAQDSEERTVK